MGTDLRETGTTLDLRYDGRGLAPCVTTCAKTGRVLMLAWMNARALAATIETGQAHYWSRSRNELWRKGATSGHTQEVAAIRVDCDQDAVWLTVRQTGPACHTGESSCFYRRVATRDGAILLEREEEMTT